MKRMILTATAVLCFFSAFSQTDDSYGFVTIKANPVTSVKNQYRSGTCWCFSTLSFLESELLRTGKGEFDFSEAFVVSKTMMDRADKAVRTHGDVSFTCGGSAYDVIYCLKNYGLIPQDAMPAMGSLKGDTLPENFDMDNAAESLVKQVAKSDAKKLSPLWKQTVQSVYDTYLGKCPEKFSYKGKEYTPKSFAAWLGINPDDYVSITSYTHHPFYEKFILEIPDNWRWDASYNVTMNEMIAVIDNAIKNGFTVAWGSDVSEDGFTRNGLAVYPDVKKYVEAKDSDMARFVGLSSSDKKEELTKEPLPEIVPTQEMRQSAYDNWETTDDHGMVIFGLAKDKNGKEYYMVKNSWGTSSKYKGVWYASKAFVAYKTMDILVHKDALPSDIKKKLGIK